MKAAAEQAIQRNALLDAHTIKVDVDGHELTLSGNVRSFPGRRQAEHAAWAAARVTSVRNHLLVTPVIHARPAGTGRRIYRWPVQALRPQPPQRSRPKSSHCP
jgi:hypothetical protein